MTVTGLSRFHNILWLAIFALLTASVQAQQPTGIAAEVPDSRTLRVQRKADELFERGEFDRAYIIYRNELAPHGDKYAQYMVGFMHLTGMGIDEDPVAASAWYRLAAERGTRQFVAVHEMLMSDMTAEERRRSDILYVEIRREYSDLAILLASIKRGMRDVRPTTGSRLSASSSPMTVIEAKSPNQSRSSAEYYRRIESELEQNLMMLSELGDFPDLETDPARVNIDEVERLVIERIESTQN